MKNPIFILLITLVTLSGCQTVRQQDLDAWRGQPVEALDTHSLFLTLPVVKTKTDSGIEIRDYVNKIGVSSCFKNGFSTGNTNATALSPYNVQAVSYSNFSAFQNCSSRIVGCDNIFYIKNKKVLEYKPVGQCYTNETVQPESLYLRLKE
jgi:hypothetical protein